VRRGKRRKKVYFIPAANTSLGGGVSGREGFLPEAEEKVKHFVGRQKKNKRSNRPVKRWRPKTCNKREKRIQAT